MRCASLRRLTERTTEWPRFASAGGVRLCLAGSRAHGFSFFSGALRRGARPGGKAYRLFRAGDASLREAVASACVTIVCTKRVRLCVRRSCNRCQTSACQRHLIAQRGTPALAVASLPSLASVHLCRSASRALRLYVKRAGCVNVFIHPAPPPSTVVWCVRVCLTSRPVLRGDCRRRRLACL